MQRQQLRPKLLPCALIKSYLQKMHVHPTDENQATLSLSELQNIQKTKLQS